MQKKRFLTLLGSLLLILVIIVSTSMTVHAQQPIKIRIYFGTSLQGGMGQLMTEFFKRIDQATKGRTESTIFGGSILSSPGELYNNIKSGAIDMGQDVTGNYPGKFPLVEVMQLPFLNLPNTLIGSRVFWELYEKFPEFRAQFEGIKVVTTLTSGPQPLGTNKPVRTMENLKGMKIRVLAGPPTDMMKALGGTPVLMPPPDIYTSMERKVIDGWMWSWEASVGNKLTEVTDYFTSLSAFQPTLFIPMSLALWNKLPPDIQKVFDEIGGAAGAEFFGRGVDRFNEIEKAKVAGMKGKQIIELSPEETKKWQEACKPIWDKWVANTEAKGLPGKAVLAEAQKLAEKYIAEYRK